MKEQCLGYYREEGKNRDGLLEEMATALFFKWTWIADEKLQLSFTIRPIKQKFIGVQQANYEMSYILFSFPTPHIILDSKDLWASLVQKEWVLLQWAPLWGIVDTRPVPVSRHSEEEGQVSAGVSPTIGRTSPHDSLTKHLTPVWILKVRLQAIKDIEVVHSDSGPRWGPFPVGWP